MSARERLIGPEPEPGEERILASLRPTTLDDTEYIGQHEVVRPLKIALQAANQRGEPLDHALFYGPPGLGKTTLAQLIRHELGSQMVPTAGPVLRRLADLLRLLSHVQSGDV